MITRRSIVPRTGHRDLGVHAIYTVLNEVDLFAASVASIYDFVQGITVITEYDRDWTGKPVMPDELVNRILDRSLDPSSKINLIVAPETNEARARNRAMDFSDPGPKSRRVRCQHRSDRPLPAVDYFWIIDADEIYESTAVAQLLAYIGKGRKPYYRVAARRYFKTWNYVIEGDEWFTVFVRSDRRLGAQRNPYRYPVERLLGRMHIKASVLSRLKGVEDIPSDVALFHHGSYVGPRERIAAKVGGFSHSAQIAPDWLDAVWAKWDPGWRDFHPVHPAAFPSARRVDRAGLPPEIRDWAWPEGYLSDST